VTVEHTTDGPALGRVRVRVGYHGAAFHGFAANEGVQTVEGALVGALSTVLRRRTEISAAGRTDAGVHARAQVISFDAPRNTDLAAMVRSVNALCAPHVAVSDARFVDDDFDARHSATWREYRYAVLVTREPDPLLVDRAWHVHDDLDIALMNLACDALMGEQDFSAFCRKVAVAEGMEPKSLRRRVFAARWRPGDDGTVVFEIRANAFCHQMVRSLVGFLVDVGRRRRPPSDARAVIVSGDRSHGSQVAPPHGLVLWDVGYDGVRVHP
jgi:tRNA pseudouridine38-40 synthase